MGRKIKIEVTIEVEGESHIDDAILKRIITPLGEVLSCKIDNNFDEISNKAKPKMHIAQQSSRGHPPPGLGLSVFLIEYDVFPIHFCASRARYVATAGATCGHALLP